MRNMMNSMGPMMDGSWGWGMMLACGLFGIALLAALVFLTVFLGKKFFSTRNRRQNHN